MLTIKDCISQLPEGSDQLVIALHVAATAPDRHAARVVASTQVARDYLESSDDIDGDVTDRMVGTLLTLEAGGTGGRGGFGLGDDGDRGTSRMSWAGRLGKGRRHASDGGAWTAAITQAGSTMTERPDPHDVSAILPAIRPVDLAWPLAYALRRAYELRFAPALSGAWAELARAVAARCESDDDAGRLATRYGLPTRRHRRSGEALVTNETAAAMLSVITQDAQDETDDSVSS